MPIDHDTSLSDTTRQDDAADDDAERAPAEAPLDDSHARPSRPAMWGWIA